MEAFKLALNNRTVLDEIILNKRKEVQALSRSSINEFKRCIDSMSPPRDFRGAISGHDKAAIIAEIKKVSPSLGAIRPGADVSEIAGMYERGGAAAVSVLTDAKFFGGSIEDLMEVRKSVDLPILRKDFIIDEIQIYEARAHGADAVLLIVAALDDKQLMDFHQIADGLGLSALVETHSADEIDRALKINPEVVGINNRCLKTLKVDISTSENLRHLIPDCVCVVSESGISKPSDSLRLRRSGINAFLIGTSLIKSVNPEQTLKEFTEC